MKKEKEAKAKGERHVPTNVTKKKKEKDVKKKKEKNVKKKKTTRIPYEPVNSIRRLFSVYKFNVPQIVKALLTECKDILKECRRDRKNLEDVKVWKKYEEDLTKALGYLPTEKKKMNRKLDVLYYTRYKHEDILARELIRQARKEKVNGRALKAISSAFGK